MPEELGDRMIAPIFKKGCMPYCGRLRDDTSIGEEPFGIMTGRGTTYLQQVS